MVTAFNNTLLTLFDVHAPVKKITIKGQKYPWITYNIKLMMRRRDEAYLQMRMNKNDIHKKKFYIDLKKNSRRSNVQRKTSLFYLLC